MDADQRQLDTVATHTWSGPDGPGANRFNLSGSTVGRFVIHERLGIGGMGEVYRAEDTQLKRTVAIKRLLKNDDPQSAARLLKEAQRASALNHARIASVYDVFATADELLLVMEYIDGMTLRERMKQPIAVSEFCTIALQCTEALSAAHDKGILHGDLKPANIMLTRDGEIKVCDFGLARPLPTAEPSAETTASHVVVGGTPGYVAPEGILGREVDERADLFSLGIVFYQMLAVRHPFVGGSLTDTIERILHHTPEPLERVNPNVPVRLARTVQRMLEKDPNARFANAAAVGEALSLIRAEDARAQHRRQRLRRLRTAAALVATATLVVFTMPRAATPLPATINLAVLPFVVAGTADDARQRFTAGLGESLNDQLSRLTDSRKIQVATAADRRSRNVANVADARDHLGANVALTGRLQYTGQNIQVATALVDTTTGRQLRAETFTAPFADTLAVQTRVVESVMRMLAIELDPNERMRLNVHTMQPGAWDFYLQARGYLLNYDRIESVDAAIAVFRKALDVEERYALAYAGLGQAYWRKFELTGSAALVEPARANCEGARAIDPSLAESHACLGMVLNGTGEYERAAAEYGDALDVDPTNDLAYIGLATAYEKLGRHGDAERTYRRAIDRRPHYWGGYNNLGGYYYRFGRYKDALTMFQQVVDLAPDSFRGHSSLGAVHFMLDQTTEAVAALKKSLEIRPNFVAASNLGTLYYFEGQYRLSADLFRQAAKLDSNSYQVWGNLAQTLDHIGEHEEAAVAFQQARRLAMERLAVNQRDAALHIAVAHFSAALGSMDEATRELTETLKLAPDDAHTLFRISVFYEDKLKSRDEALAWLTKAVERGQTWREIDRAPELRQLRADPRFQQLRRSR